MSNIKNIDLGGTERFGRLIFATVRQNVGLKGLKIISATENLSKALQ